MKAAQYLYNEQKDLQSFEKNDDVNCEKVQLVLAFGAKEVLAINKIYTLLRAKFSNADIAICSTAGEIYSNSVSDGTVSIIAFEFAKTKIVSHQINTSNCTNCFDSGIKLMQKFDKTDLSYVLVLSDGNTVNGSQLVNGLNSVAGKIKVSGGLAGDGVNFTSTLVGLNEEPSENNIVAIGFYGNSLKVTHGSMGGWDMFGLERTATKSNYNQLFEIDNQNALELYKTYLCNYANELPGSALLFPLSVVVPGSQEPVVRTILKINEENQSMIFAGDIPEGSQLKFMRANFDKLVDAATNAAEVSMEELSNNPPQVALLISCVGRKIILGPRVEEEVEAVDNMFKGKTLLTGFYSYGEISPFNASTKCELHNQTMTITTLSEI